MATPTTNYALLKPTEGADDDLWGGYQNDAFDIIDAQMKANEDAIAAIDTEAFKVGAVYISVTGVNPATELGYGTWSAFAEGRVLVGVGSNGEQTWAGAEARGSETHTLTAAEMPTHAHLNDPPNGTTNTTGNHTHTYTDSGGGGTSFVDAVNYGNEAVRNNTQIGRTTSTAGNHSHVTYNPDFWSGNAGSSGAHNNVQPSIGVYMWQRTA